MASKEQLELAEEIKKVHLGLRTRSQEVGPIQAWNEHLEKKEMLHNYAIAMKTLAENFWTKNNQGNRKSLCRLDWIHHVVQEYYFGGLRDKEIKKELLRFKLLNFTHYYEHYDQIQKLKMLDVGSCYNPFKKFSLFETYAIDLCPALDDVKQCNFLDVLTSTTVPDSWYSETISEIPSNFFDVAVFCLFLEYLPSPEQRLKACQLVVEVLKPGGMLAVVTPDSNHPSANSKLMKSWKIAFAQCGLIRFRIEKLKYLYCMAFRKTSFIDEYKNLPEYRCNDTPKIIIPQDLVSYGSKSEVHIKFSEKDLKSGFFELPDESAFL